MILTIDGPAGSGKSTTARAVAARLGIRHLESGGFYRALTLAALRAGIPAGRWDALTADELAALRVASRAGDGGFRFLIDGEDVTEALRGPDVTARVSHMARVPSVRAWLLERLRDTARSGDLVADGRDMGTVVFPDADLKVFLTASASTRARRRLAQEGASDAPDPETLAGEVRRLLERDRMDAEREVAPLRRADDAVVLDTTGLDFDEQVGIIASLARTRGAPSHSP